MGSIIGNVQRFDSVRIDAGAEQCLSPITLALVDYWHAKTPAGYGLPRWKDFELMDLYKIANCLAVKDVVDGGSDFRNRYWGSRLTSNLGFDGTGKLVSTYQPKEMRDKVMVRYMNIAKTGCTSMVRGRLQSVPGKEFVTVELVHLPLSASGTEVTNIISAYHFGFQAPA